MLYTKPTPSVKTTLTTTETKEDSVKEINVKDGIKYDKDKARWDLLDYDFISQAVDVLTFGAQKYGPESWRKVENGRERYFAALMRHLIAWRNGEADDEETLKSHLAHCVCNLMFIYNFDKEKK